MCVYVAICISLHVEGAALFEYHDFVENFPSQTQEPRVQDAVVLQCVADNSMQIVVGWTMNGVNVSESTLEFTTSGNQLTISSFSADYDAIYQCIAMNLYGGNANPQLSPPILVSAFGKYQLSQQRVIPSAEY